jgi:hypothetical protein
MKSITQFTCTFCGAEVTNSDYCGGEWHGPDSNVYCCGHCATDVLPALIADSIHIYGRPYSKAKERLDRIERTFWKALAARASRKEV